MKTEALYQERDKTKDELIEELKSCIDFDAIEMDANDALKINRLGKKIASLTEQIEKDSGQSVKETEDDILLDNKEYD